MALVDYNSGSKLIRRWQPVCGRLACVAADAPVSTTTHTPGSSPT